MMYISSFAIFFVVYFVMSFLVNRMIKQREKKDIKMIANHSFYAGMIYVLAMMLFRSLGNLFNK